MTRRTRTTRRGSRCSCSGLLAKPKLREREGCPMRMVWRDLAKHGFALPADIGHAALIGHAASAMMHRVWWSCSESVGAEYRGGGSYAYACTAGREPRRARCGCRRRSTTSTQASGAAQATCARGVVCAFCSRRASMVDALAQSPVRRARESATHARDATRRGDIGDRTVASPLKHTSSVLPSAR